jgi:hypothetical protein
MTTYFVVFLYQKNAVKHMEMRWYQIQAAVQQSLWRRDEVQILAN